MKWEFLYNSCCCSLCTQLKFMFHFYKKWCSSYTSAEKFKLFDFLFSDAHIHKLTHTHTHLKRKYDVEKFVFDMVTHTVFFFWYSSHKLRVTISLAKFPNQEKSSSLIWPIPFPFTLTAFVPPFFAIPLILPKFFISLFIYSVHHKSIDRIGQSGFKWTAMN